MLWWSTWSFFVVIILAHNGLVIALTTEFSTYSGLRFGRMETYLKVKSVVFHLEADNFIPGNILYVDGSSLMTTDGKTKHLIVGSDIGYAEGISDKALFHFIAGFLQTNSSHVLVADYRNSCLRYVSRLTNSTSAFAGACQSTGFSDGKNANAKFTGPAKVIRNPHSPNTAIVTDWFNNALRLIDLATGDVKTLVRDLPLLPYGATFDSDNENIFITTEKCLVKYNLKLRKFYQMDWECRNHSFVSPRDIVCKKNICIVVDWYSNQLRIVDVNNMTTSLICNGFPDSIDGTTANCSLRIPWGLLLVSDTLYIGCDTIIRKITVKDVFTCKDMSATMPAGEKVKCVEVIPGRNICLPPGVSQYVIPEENCTIHVNIAEGNSKSVLEDPYKIVLGVVIAVLMIVIASVTAAFIYHRRKSIPRALRFSTLVQ